MEKVIEIKTQDKHIIYGTLNFKVKSDKLIIFVHGLTGNKNEHIFFNGYKYFNLNGYDTFRFDLYTDSKLGRTLLECTIDTHAEDVSTVLDYFSGKYKKIYLVGHSFGGPSILFSTQKNVEKIVLWDPSLSHLTLIEDLEYSKALNCYKIKWCVESLMSIDMFENWKKKDKLMVGFIKRPTKIICAEKGILLDMWEKEKKNIGKDCKIVMIKNADHCFNNEGNEEDLFDETLKWFNKSK